MLFRVISVIKPKTRERVSRNGSCTMKCLAIVLCIGVKSFYFTNVTEIKYCFGGFVLDSSVI